MPLVSEIGLRLSSQSVASTGATSLGWLLAYRGFVPSTHGQQVAVIPTGGYQQLAEESDNVLARPTFQVLVRGKDTSSYGTNICLQSQTFGTTWSPRQATVSSNADTAPDGATTADRLIEDSTAASTHSIQQGSLTVTAAGQVAFSVYAKAGTRTWTRLRLVNGSDQCGAYFNLDTGATGTTVDAGSGVLTSKTVEAAANGWYRIAIIGTLGGAITSATAEIFIAEADSDVTFDGGGVKYISLWGAQVENATTSVSPYVVTTTASKTGGTELEDRVDSVITALNLYNGVLVGHAYKDIRLEGEPLWLGRDENQRPMYSCNFSAFRSRTT